MLILYVCVWGDEYILYVLYVVYVLIYLGILKCVCTYLDGYTLKPYIVNGIHRLS